MDAITYSEARKQLGRTMNRVCNDREPLIITRQKKRSVVMLSLADYESLAETAYLLNSPTNALRLLNAAQQLDAGNGKRHKLKLGR